MELDEDNFINKNEFIKFLTPFFSQETNSLIRFPDNIKIKFEICDEENDKIIFDLYFLLNTYFVADQILLIGDTAFNGQNLIFTMQPKIENQQLKLNATLKTATTGTTVYSSTKNNNNELSFTNTTSSQIWIDVSDSMDSMNIPDSNYGKYFLTIGNYLERLSLALTGYDQIEGTEENNYFSSYRAIFSTSKDDIIYTAYVYQNEDDNNKSHLEISSLSTKLNINDTAYRTASIPMGQVDNTSTATIFTATIPGITELRNGVCVWLRNGVVTSAEGFTININNLGAKPCYSSLAAQSRSTTVFNVNYTMLLIYNETRVADGCWDVVYGYDSNTNTIGYQLRTNNTSLPVSSATYRYRLLFTSADGTKFIPANSSSSTNATSKRDVIQTKINPFGQIVYYGYTTAVSANNRPGVIYLWTQYNINLGYSFNRTGAALSLTSWKPVYIKCAPQADGSAIIDSTTPFVQTLPTTADGKIYIFLGIATSAENVELVPQHPIYCYRNNGIQIWTGLQAEIDAINVGVTNITTGTGLTGGPITSTGTISLADNYGDTKNPYGTKTVNYILAGPSSGNPATPTFRELVADDIPSITKSKISDFPTQVSSFTNDAGYLTQETDPTVPSWAKASNKPSYSLDEITGAEDIQVIEALNGTGLLVKDGTNSWYLDATNYVTQSEIDTLIGVHEEDLATVWNFISSNGLNDNATITLNASLMSLVYAAQQKHLQFYVLWETANSHAIKFEIDEINMATNTAKFHSNCGNILYTIEMNSNSVTESPMTGSLSVRTLHTLTIGSSSCQVFATDNITIPIYNGTYN